MLFSELTQKFRRRGEIAPKNKPDERWRITRLFDTDCFIRKVHSDYCKSIDYEGLDRDWMPYKKPKSKPVVIESAKDKFGNDLRVGDEVYYATSYHWGRGYAIEKGKVTGFTPCYVIVDGGSVSPDKIGKI